MGCLNWVRVFCFAISLMVFMPCNNNPSSQLRLFVEGRRLSSETPEINSKTAMLQAQIGSRPPRCAGRCASCRHCEAIQVPTVPPIWNSAVSAVAYARGEGNSNYKPMSWKCKCGNLIFNP